MQDLRISEVIWKDSPTTITVYVCLNGFYKISVKQSSKQIILFNN